MGGYRSLDGPTGLDSVLTDHYERLAPAVLARIEDAGVESEPPFGSAGTERTAAPETVARQATCLLMDVLVVSHCRLASDTPVRFEPATLESLARTPTDEDVGAWADDYDSLRQHLTTIPGGTLFESQPGCLSGRRLAETAEVCRALASLNRSLARRDCRRVRPTLTSAFDLVAGANAPGCVYTPPAVADVLAAWSVRAETDRVLDPACGGGQLLASALRRLDVMADGRVDGTQLLGIDRDSTATDLSALALAAHPVDTAGGPTIRSADFFDVCPPADSGVSALDDVDAVVLNPPFTRPEHLADGYRSAVRDAVDGAEAHLPKRAGLYVYFLVAVTRLLDDGDRLAAVVPSSAFSADYAGAVESFLCDHYDVAAVLGTHRHPVVPTADVHALVVLLTRRCGGRPRSTGVSFGLLDRPFDAIDPETVAAGYWDSLDAKVRHVDQHRLRSGVDGLPSLFDHKWSGLLRVGERVGRLLDRDAGRFVRVGDLGRVAYGFKPGAVRFYLLPRPGTEAGGLGTACEDATGRLVVDHGDRSYAIEHDCWMRSVERGRTDGAVDASRRSIDGESWVPRYALKSSTELDTRHIDGDDPAYVLVSSGVPPERLEAERPGFAAHVRWGESQGFHERASVESRDPWYSVDPPEPGTLLLKQFHDRRLFHPVNAAGVVPTNTFQQLHAEDAPPAYLTGYLNSTLGLVLTELFGRTNLGAGALTVYGSDFERIPIPDVEGEPLVFADALAPLRNAPARPVADELGAETPADVTLAGVRPARRRLDELVFEDLLDWSEDDQLAVYRELLRLVEGRTAKADSRQR